MKMAKTATMNQFDLAKLGLYKMTSKGNLYEPSTKGVVTFEGYLFKKSPGGIPLMRHWHKRWFVLESPGKLLYYADQAKTDLKGIIPLDMIEKMLFRATRLTLLMEGTSDNAPPRKFSLKAESDTEIKTWGTAINKAFEELDRIDEEDERDHKMDDIGEDNAKYWKVETRKKLNLSVTLEDKPKKKKLELKIDPRAKEIEAQIAEREAAERKNSDAVADPSRTDAAGYMPLNDDHVVLPEESLASTSPPPTEKEEEQAALARQQVESAQPQRAREEADLVAALLASQIEQQPKVAAEQQPAVVVEHQPTVAVA